MRKKLFERYVDFNYYRLVNKQLLKQKLITRAEYRALEERVDELETVLLVPKQSKSHRQRTMMVVK